MTTKTEICISVDLYWVLYRCKNNPKRVAVVFLMFYFDNSYKDLFCTTENLFCTIWFTFSGLYYTFLVAMSSQTVEMSPMRSTQSLSSISAMEYFYELLQNKTVNNSWCLSRLHLLCMYETHTQIHFSLNFPTPLYLTLSQGHQMWHGSS